MEGAYKMESSESLEDEIEVIHASVVLPELDETQIWDDEQDKREICLYLETKKGKVHGMEYVPFELPYRWTFATLKSCVHDFVARMVANGDHNKVKINQMYFKKSGNSKSVVVLNSDRDIPAMLQEYPLQYPSGKRKSGRKAVITMAVDWTEVQEPSSPVLFADTPKRSFHSPAAESLILTPRRSPRLAAQNKKVMDVFVFEVTKGKNNPKLSTTSSILHNVSQQCDIEKFKDRLLTMRDSSIFVPAKGLYWLRKRNKQMVQLNTEEDWRLCKEEYSDGKGNISSVRIACSSVSYEHSGAAGDALNTSRKRSLDFESSSSNCLDEVQKTKVKAGDNELWNEVHLSLIRDLEKKGIKARYGVKHLKLWTDLIIDGSSTGIGDEPQWEKYIDQVGIPPKSPRGQMQSSPKGTPTDDLLKTLIIQNQQRMDIESRRAEAFQNSLLAIIANNNSPNVNKQVPLMNNTPSTSNAHDNSYEEMKIDEGKAVQELSREDVQKLLERLGLQCYIPTFLKNDIDGPMLEAITDPVIGEGLFVNLDIHDKEHRQRLITEVYRAKVHGFK